MAAKPAQSNAMLYTVITFVSLFIISTICAVIFYVKTEDFRTQRNAAQEQLNKIANTSEQRQLDSLVGKPVGRKTYLGTLLQYIDDLTSAVTGQIPEKTTAAVKVNDAKLKINEMMENIDPEVAKNFGPDGVDLVQTINDLQFKLDTTAENLRTMEERLRNLQDEFDLKLENYQASEQQLLEEKNRFQTAAQEAQEMYEQLERQMQQANQQQLDTYKSNQQKTVEQLNEQKLTAMRAQEQMEKMNDSLNTAIARLEAIKPKPGVEVEAYKPDASIVRIDPVADVVFLDIGSNDHAYRGLTFSVYDKSAPIPQDGKGKAEIEIYQLTPNASAAKINRSSKKNPIVKDDIVANLIWDRTSENKFVLAGMFDFDRDGKVEPEGREKIQNLIEKWGGQIADEVTIETDFVILGFKPEPMSQPTLTQIQNNPMIQQQYEENQQQIEQWESTLEAAGRLSVPVFNQKRFLYLIGYESIASKTTPTY